MSFSPTSAPCAGTMDEVYSNCIRSYQSENKRLKDQNRNLKQKLQTLTEDSKKLQDIYSGVSQDHSTLMSHIEDVETQNSIYQKQIKSQEKIIQKEKSQNVYLQQEISKLLEVVNKSVKNQEQLAQELQFKTQKCQTMQLQAKNLEEKIQDLTSELSSSIDSIHATESALEQTTLNFEESKTENKRIAIRLAETEGSLREIQLANEQLRKVISEMESDQKMNSNTLNYNLKAETYTNSENEANLANLTSEINVIKTENKKLQK